MRCAHCSVLNPSGMRFCGNCAAPLKAATLERERRMVSVMFIDLSGFSTLTRHWIPEQLRDLADEILTVVAGIVEDYDGYVDAFQGDGLIALFGAPHSHPDDPHRAVLAAVSGLRAIETIGHSKGHTLQGRAGVNTGIVIAGAIGSGRVRDYTVMGSPVNLAARLEAAAQPGEVWVGPETFEQTRHRIVFEKVGPVTLAGFPNIQEVYKFVSFNEDAADPYAHLDFVGREQELERLAGAYQRALQEGRTQTLWVVGEAGMGKSRLIREFSHRLGASANVVWVDEQSLDRDTGWRQLAAQLFGLSLGDDKRTWQQTVTQNLERLLPDQPRWHHNILSSLGLAKVASWRRLERRKVDRTFLAWRDLVSAFVEQTAEQTTGAGLVFIVEHSSQAVAFSHFPDLLAEVKAPVLLLRTRRRYDLDEHAAHLTLIPLSHEESLCLVKQVADPTLQVATQSLVFQVGGIPSNLLELGRALSSLPQSSFSGSLASLLQARLDMLPAPSRQVLALAALAGEKFWGGFIRDVSGSVDALQSLLDESLIVKEVNSLIPGESEYHFQSELVRRAVLRMIPYSERPTLHLSAATWLERYAPLALSELVAHHFQEGGSGEAAYPHYLAAADLAVSDLAFERAYALFTTLLALELPPQLLAQGALAYAQAAIYNCDQALALEQLSAADQWIELSLGESKDALRQVHAQLFEDVQALA